MTTQTTDKVLNRTDSYGNELIFMDNENGWTDVKLRLAVDQRYRHIGVLTDHGEMREYRKREDEGNKYNKLKAWTVHEEMAKSADFIVYETDFATYTITSKEALKMGQQIRHRGSSFENKVAVPIRYWDIGVKDRKHVNLIRHFGYEWYDELKDELSKRYVAEISHRVAARRKVTTVYPAPEDMFRAFKLTPFNDVKVVIIGQDPYHDGSANGLAFSVNSDTMKIPPSLLNINKELEKDVFDGVNLFKRVDLSNWASQGVFLINTFLSVEAGKPGSHAAYGWDKFTAAAIRKLLLRPGKPIVFMLWGNHAQNTFKPIIEETGKGSHLILTAPHPSPFSADKGFFGCKHFSKCNSFLQVTNQRQIVW